MSKRRIALVVAAIAALSTLGACSGEDTEAGPADDGGGSLEAVIDAAGETTGFGDFTTGSEKSFGVFVCTRDGSVEIESVEPTHTEGDIEYLGTSVYTSDEKFVGAAHGFPPDGIEEAKLGPAEGAVVDADCGGSGDEKVQLLVGAERTGVEGGVLDGFVVIYDGGELEIPLTVLLCGDEMEFCEALVPADDA